ncbi:hypothetical protein SELMODRAFT_93746 [Selaginella moellendorffii]|uniref:Pectate lyase n=1 Tax=Selaginella moellendorffii TaxID=88036 RepID=D8RHJ2_SELML|nr:hypothetical protein SELMODRAFT_93746 [Selaginella moellendorffii]
MNRLRKCCCPGIEIHHGTPDPAPSVPGPYANVDSRLRALARAAQGFGSASIGGLEGAVYHVTTLADDGPGSLRYGCRQEQPLWIVFDLSGNISVSSAIRVASRKTLDGRGQRIKITGHGIQLKKCEHIIICNLEFQGGRGHDVDGIQIKPNTEKVWIDRCSLSDYDDGLIDITRQSTDITVSRCHFHHHDKTMLISADAKHIEDRNMRITIHHCFFDGTRQRHPRVRFAKVHLYNNYTRNWGIYAVCASVESQICSQGNVYQAGSKKKVFEYYTEKASIYRKEFTAFTTVSLQALDKNEAECGCVCSSGDVFLGGAQWEARNPHQVFRPESCYSNCTIEAAGPELVDKVCKIAGWQNVALPPDW